MTERLASGGVYGTPYHEPKHYEMKYPELIVDKTPGPEFLIDPISEDPLILFGRTVVIDKWMKRQIARVMAEAEKAKAKRRKAKKPKGAKGKRSNLKAS